MRLNRTVVLCSTKMYQIYNASLFMDFNIVLTIH